MQLNDLSSEINIVHVLRHRLATAKRRTRLREVIRTEYENHSFNIVTDSRLNLFRLLKSNLKNFSRESNYYIFHDLPEKNYKFMHNFTTNTTYEKKLSRQGVQ